MKHKAQESLDTAKWLLSPLYVKNVEAYQRIADETKEELEKIQDLINCQLTVEEVNKCLMALGHFEDDLDMGGGLTPLKIKIFKNIKYKLKKQKEMWVSEDERI